MNIPNIDIKKTGQAAGILLAGLLLGWLLFGGSSTQQDREMTQHLEEAHTDEEGNIVYTCSMHPSVRQNEPGNCPICGMELIPVSDSKSGSTGEDAYTLTMTPASMKLAQIQTAPVTTGKAIMQIRLPGKVVVDERRISSVTAHFPGRIKELYVDFTGDRVRKGEKLASVYSPQLITAQRELMEARKYRENNPALYRATRRKLELWELPEEEIRAIEESGEIREEVNIVSPVDGYVLKRNISRQDHVMEGTIMYQIANLERLWVEFDAYESDLIGLKIDDTVMFDVAAFPGEKFEATVSYIYPTVDERSRTVKVRTEVENEELRLKPQMLTEGVLYSELSEKSDHLLIPRSAVLWTGERSVVYVKRPETEQPTFEAREITLGPRVGRFYVVKSGVAAGEEVVVNGTFKLDSAAQLSDKLSMMNRAPGQSGGRAPSSHDHGQETMQQEISMEMTDEKKPGQEIPADFRKQLAGIIESYLSLKDALVASDPAEASRAARRVAIQLQEIDSGGLDTSQRDQWMVHQSSLLKAAESIREAEEMETQRNRFINLSDHLSKTIAHFGISGEQLFLQYCPMANNNDGAYWLSRSHEIRNPYFGRQMLNCGETIETINPTQ